MGVYSEYLDKKLSFDQLSKERKKELKKISQIRQRDVLVFASDVAKDCPNSIDYSDKLPFSDQLAQIKGSSLDIILETPGGLADVVEDLVMLIRSRFDHVGVIVPGMAKSAGTIFTMAADEILMGEISALGPIDAQIMNRGKRYSADAFLAGLEKIKQEAESKQKLDLAYIPILQNISPGEIQHCENAQAFSRTLVTKWLKQYKFKYWTKHRSSGKAVTEEEKEKRALDIAEKLCDQGSWLTHSRSIDIKALADLKLEVIDYSLMPDLNDAITRYYTLLRMSFETNLYKIYETTTSQIYRMLNPAGQKTQPQPLKLPNPAVIDFECGKCHNKQKIQANFDRDFPIEPGAVKFPSDNILKCSACGADSNLLVLRQQLEAQTKKKIL